MAFGLPTTEMKDVLLRTHTTLDKVDRVLDETALLVRSLNDTLTAIRQVVVIATEAIATQLPKR